MKKLYIRNSTIAGKGLFANQDFKTGDFVGFVKGPKIRVKKFTPKLANESPNWFGVSKQIWINPLDSEFRYINHTCDPNCALVSPRKVIAIKNIKKDTEVTIDYSLNESDLDWQITSCHCGAKNCRKHITAIQLLDLEVFKAKENHIQKVFQQIFKKNYPHQLIFKKKKSV